MIKRATLSAVVLATALAGFTGPAWGGNGHGNGNGNGNASGNSEAAPAAAPAPATTASPGNSANAQGREKKSEPTQAGSSTPGHGKKSSTTGHGNSTNPPTSAGVKPTNSTSKDTNAPAASNRTKRYGNGKTAGQIAIQHGYPANGNLHGPGNSQPHKVVCGHRHGVDVHALKGHTSKTCTGGAPSEHSATQSSPGGASDASNRSTSPGGASGASDRSTSHGSTSTSITHSGSSSTKRESRVVWSKAASDPEGGLEATATFGRGNLPFTGFPLWALTGVALALIVLGLAIQGPCPARVRRAVERRFGSEPRA